MSAAAWIYGVCSAIFATPREAAVFRNPGLTITHPSTGKYLRRGYEFWCHYQPNGNPIRGSHEKIKMTTFSDTIRTTLTSCHPLNVKGPNYSANANETRYNEVTVQNRQLYAAPRPPKPVAQHCKPFASISKPFSGRAQSTKLVG
jgi:hypothetical protein